MSRKIAVLLTIVFLLMLIDRTIYGYELSTSKTSEKASANNESILPPGDAMLNFRDKTVRLNSGHVMPIVGLGTYSLSHKVCVNSVLKHLEAGGRLIDTAYMYGNEKAVGEAIGLSGIPREEIFVITKLYPSQYANAEAAIEEALRKLDTGYIDMLLLHHPGEHDVEAYRAMERAARKGKIRSLGLSCFYIRELERFLPSVTIMPSIVQNEIHPYYQDIEVVPYIQAKNIIVQAWYPLGGRGYVKKMLADPVICKIARSHGKTAAQIILRWNLQRGVSVIPGSANPQHIRENLDIFDFELSKEDMEAIRNLNRNEKHDWY